MEAPSTGVLTAYIMAFGGEVSFTFYLGVTMSFVSIAKVAMTINFYGKNPSAGDPGKLLQI